MGKRIPFVTYFCQPEYQWSLPGCAANCPALPEGGVTPFLSFRSVLTVLPKSSWLSKSYTCASTSQAQRLTASPSGLIRTMNLMFRNKLGSRERAHFVKSIPSSHTPRPTQCARPASRGHDPAHKLAQPRKPSVRPTHRATCLKIGTIRNQRPRTHLSAHTRASSLACPGLQGSSTQLLPKKTKGRQRVPPGH